MCLAIPGKIVNIDGDMGDVDFGGVTRKANLSMVDAQVGDWAVVHAGFAIQLMDEEDAQETIRLWNEVLDSDTTTFNRDPLGARKGPGILISSSVSCRPSSDG